MKKFFTALLCLLLAAALLFPVIASVTGVFLSAPQITSLTNTRDGLKILWDKVTDAEYYRIYKKTDDKWVTLKTVKATELSYTDSNAQSGAVSKYTLRAYNKTNGVWSLAGHAKSAFYVSSPDVTVKNEIKGIKFTWKAISGADTVKLFKKSSSGWECIKASDGSASSFTDKAVNNNTKYYYYVKSYGKEANGERTEIIPQKFLKAPASLKASNKTDGVKLTWKKTAGADSYIVYKRTENNGYKRAAVVKTNSYKDKNVKNNTKYIYTVKAQSGNFVSCQNKQEESCKFIAPPAFNSPVLKKNGVSLSWSKYPDAVKYRIYRKTVGKEYTLLKETTSLSYTDKTAKKGKAYVYALKVITNSATSGICNGIKVRLLDVNKPMVALTYDDGPYSPNTDRILNALEKVGGKATFFVVGNRVNTYKSSVEKAVKMGCEIGNHTYTHSILTGDSSSTIKSELSKCNKAVKSVTGTAPVIMRPPGGDVNSTVEASCNMPMIIWSIDTRDWETQNAASTVSKIKKCVEDGDIILMHDLYSATASASETIIPWLVSKGYQLVTVSELMQAKGINMKGGVRYFDAIK